MHECRNQALVDDIIPVDLCLPNMWRREILNDWKASGGRMNLSSEGDMKVLPVSFENADHPSVNGRYQDRSLVGP